MPDERAAIDRVGRYWDVVVLGGESAAMDLEPDLATAIHRVHELGAMPPSFAQERVWRNVLANVEDTRRTEEAPMLFAITPDQLPLSMPGAGLAGREEISGRRHRWLVAQLATAALLVVALAGSFLAFGPGRFDRKVQSPAFISAVTGTPTPSSETASSPVAEFVWQTEGGPGLPLDAPYKIAIDPAGNLWVADGLNSRFQIFAPDGDFLESWGTKGSGNGQFNLPLFGYGYGAVVWDADGNFYVTDSGNHRIQKFAPDRTFIAAWGSEGRKDGQFIGLNDLALDGHGRLYAADHDRDDIQVFDRDGHFLDAWGGAGLEEGQLLNPGGIEVDADGNLYISEFQGHRIQKLSPDGTPLAVWGTYGTEKGAFNNPADVALDGQGRVFVADWSNQRVQVFDLEGRFMAVWGGIGTEEGQFMSPVGVVLDGEGFAYVSDEGSDRVQKFRLLPPLAPG